MGLLDKFFTKEIIAVDIGTINIKLLSGYKKDNLVTVKNFGMISFMSETVLDTSHIFEESLSQLINRLITNLRITSKNFAFAIPASFSFLVNFTLPRINEKNLANAVKFEAQKFLPIEINETIYNYRYFLKETPGEESQYLVFLVASPLSFKKKMESVVRNLKSKLVSIESEIFSLEKYFSNNLETNVLVNIGHAYTLLMGLITGKVIFAKKIDYGGKILVSGVSEVLKTNTSRAVLHLKERGFYFPPEEAELNKIANIFIKNLSISIKNFVSEFEDLLLTRINKIYWSGGVCLYKGFRDKINENLPEYINVTLMPSGVLRGEKFERLEENSTIFGVAGGLLL